MKKLILFSLLAFGLAGSAFAVQKKFRVPISENNVSDENLRSAGVDHCYLVTSTTPALATDSAGTTITDGFLYYVVIPSTGMTAAQFNTLYLEIRSTGTANITSTKLVPKIPVNATISTSVPGGTTVIVPFDPPIPFQNGLSVNLTPAGTAPYAGAEFGVGVRWKRQ